MSTIEMETEFAENYGDYADYADYSDYTDYVRSNNANLNDLAGRTGRNFSRIRDEHRREVARLDQAIAGARDLSVLGAVLAGGDNASVMLPLLVVSMDQQSQQAASSGAGTPAGGMLGSNSTGLVLALAVAGALK